MSGLRDTYRIAGRERSLDRRTLESHPDGVGIDVPVPGGRLEMNGRTSLPSVASVSGVGRTSSSVAYDPAEIEFPSTVAVSAKEPTVPPPPDTARLPTRTRAKNPILAAGASGPSGSPRVAGACVQQFGRLVCHEEQARNDDRYRETETDSGEADHCARSGLVPVARGPQRIDRQFPHQLPRAVLRTVRHPHCSPPFETEQTGFEELDKRLETAYMSL